MMKKRNSTHDKDSNINSTPKPFLAYPRCAGVLLHITSLPSMFGVGDFGPQAYDFANFLKRTHQTIWQILPLNSTSSGQGFSPYGSDGSFAGNTLLISPEQLQKEGLLSKADLKEAQVKSNKIADYDKATNTKTLLLDKAYLNFKKKTSLQERFVAFCQEEKYWLNDFALFMTVKKEAENKSWYEWSDEYKNRDKKALRLFEQVHAEEIEKIKWKQWIFHKQWQSLKAYCNSIGLKIFGDLPFYVAYDSADVWANRRLFDLDSDGNMISEGGAPPDDFNREGQRWGMPVYRWEIIKKENFEWWLKRMKKNIFRYDLLRLDHFRGFSAYWEIKIEAKSAKEGAWKRVPGDAFFALLQKDMGSLPLVAEDLGSIDEPVINLRDKLAIPGMIIQQNAFGEDMPQSKSILHYHTENTVVYTGNHDNNTTLGWYQSLSKKLSKNISLYTGKKVTEDNICEVLRRLVYSSVAKLGILPMQDLLELDEHARMNSMPDDGKSWSWQMPAKWHTEKLEKELQHLCYLYDRANKQTK